MTPDDVDPVDPEDVLATVESLDVPISESDLRGTAGGQYTGIGDVRDPLNEAALGVDSPGQVALAAIQGLSERMARQQDLIEGQADAIEAQRTTVRTQRDDLESLRERLESLQAEVARLRGELEGSD